MPVDAPMNHRLSAPPNPTGVLAEARLPPPLSIAQLIVKPLKIALPYASTGTAVRSIGPAPIMASELSGAPKRMALNAADRPAWIDHTPGGPVRLSAATVTFSTPPNWSARVPQV